VRKADAALGPDYDIQIVEMHLRGRLEIRIREINAKNGFHPNFVREAPAFMLGMDSTNGVAGVVA